MELSLDSKLSRRYFEVDILGRYFGIDILRRYFQVDILYVLDILVTVILDCFWTASISRGKIVAICKP